MQPILICMFFLGIVQVLWAIILGFASNNAIVLRHLGYYAVGVGSYFAILVLLVLGIETHIGSWILAIHFFGSAACLALYHLFIVTVLALFHRSKLDPITGKYAL